MTNFAAPGGNERGLCSLSWKDSQGGGTKSLTFRTNPNSMTWKYVLNTKTQNTYGGRVIQILSTKIDDLTVVADCGRGGWPYMKHVGLFFRDLLIDQRNGTPATFEYTTRGWKLAVFAQAIPFRDKVGDVNRQFQMSFKVQEDVSGILSQVTMSTALQRLQDGVGFQLGQYNRSHSNYTSNEQGYLMTPGDTLQSALGGAQDALGNFQADLTSTGKATQANQNPLSALFGGGNNSSSGGGLSSLFPLG